MPQVNAMPKSLAIKLQVVRDTIEWRRAEPDFIEYRAELLDELDKLKQLACKEPA